MHVCIPKQEVLFVGVYVFCYCRSVGVCVYMFWVLLGSLLSIQSLYLSRLSVVLFACLSVCMYVLILVYVFFF